MTALPACPAPGIYPGVPFDEYLRWPAISNTSLHAALRSMKHYHEAVPIEETPPMRFGSLCHTGKLEPLAIAQRYVVMPPFETKIRKPDGSMYDKPRATAAYRELVAEFESVNRDKIIVTESEYQDMLGVVAALAEHPRARQFLNPRPGTLMEVAIVWREPATGLLCKGRVDVYHQHERNVGDLKTTRDAQQFERTIVDRSYHRQKAFYCDGLRVLTGEPHTATITAVETSAPFGVRAAPVSQTMLAAGRDEYRRLLDQIAQCRQSGTWPGYESPEEWSLPAWAVPDTMCVEDGVLKSW